MLFVAEATDMRVSHPPEWLQALKRYFFVKAPSRAETARQATEATVQLREDAMRLQVELARLAEAVRPPTVHQKRSGYGH